MPVTRMDSLRTRPIGQESYQWRPSDRCTAIVLAQAMKIVFIRTRKGKWCRMHRVFEPNEAIRSVSGDKL